MCSKPCQANVGSGKRKKKEKKPAQNRKQLSCLLCIIKFITTILQLYNNSKKGNEEAQRNSTEKAVERA